MKFYLSTSFSLLLLGVLVTHSYAQTPSLILSIPDSNTTGNTQEGACLGCCIKIASKINSECPKIFDDLSIPESETDDPLENLRRLSPQMRACQCGMAAPGFLDACFTENICGPLEGMRQNALMGFHSLCEILAASDPNRTSNSSTKSEGSIALSSSFSAVVTVTIFIIIGNTVGF